MKKSDQSGRLAPVLGCNVWLSSSLSERLSTSAVALVSQVYNYTLRDSANERSTKYWFVSESAHHYTCLVSARLYWRLLVGAFWAL